MLICLYVQINHPCEAHEDAFDGVFMIVYAFFKPLFGN